MNGVSPRDSRSIESNVCHNASTVEKPLPSERWVELSNKGISTSHIMCRGEVEDDALLSNTRPRVRLPQGHQRRPGHGLFTQGRLSCFDIMGHTIERQRR